VFVITFFVILILIGIYGAMAKDPERRRSARAEHLTGEQPGWRRRISGSYGQERAYVPSLRFQQYRIYTVYIVMT